MCLYCIYVFYLAIYVFVLSKYVFVLSIYVLVLSIYVLVLQEKGVINRRRLDTVLNSCGARLQPGKFYVITGNALTDCQPVECNKAY